VEGRKQGSHRHLSLTQPSHLEGGTRRGSSPIWLPRGKDRDGQGVDRPSPHSGEDHDEGVCLPVGHRLHREPPGGGSEDGSGKFTSPDRREVHDERGEANRPGNISAVPSLAPASLEGIRWGFESPRSPSSIRPVFASDHRALCGFCGISLRLDRRGGVPASGIIRPRWNAYRKKGVRRLPQPRRGRVRRSACPDAPSRTAETTPA
jgi:hypothetical protein